MRGMTFAKMAVAMARSPESVEGAAALAAARWGEESQTAKALKSVVSAAATDNWGGPLMGGYGEAITEFLALAAEQSIVGRLAGLRRVPPATPYLVQHGRARGHWVAEGREMPLSPMSFERKSLGLLKVTAVAVATKEMLTSQDAERILREDLVKAVAEASDAAFIDPTNAGVSEEMPASVTFGVAPVVMPVLDDASLGGVMSGFTGDLRSSYWIAHPQFLATFGIEQFPNVSARTGGELKGLPVIPSNAAPANKLVLLDPTAIIFAGDDARTQLKATQQGAIAMSDAPDAESAMASMWQQNCVAMAALLWQNWRVERDGAVMVLELAA